MRQVLYFSIGISGLNELAVVWKSSRGIRDAKGKKSLALKSFCLTPWGKNKWTVHAFTESM